MIFNDYWQSMLEQIPVLSEAQEINGKVAINITKLRRLMEQTWDRAQSEVFTEPPDAPEASPFGIDDLRKILHI